MIIHIITVGGQHIIGKVDEAALQRFVDSETEVLSVETPLEAHIVPMQGNGQGGAQLTMVPFGFPLIRTDPRTTSRIKFYRTTMAVSPLTASDELKKAWLQMTSGIEIATPSQAAAPGLSIVKS